MTLFYESQTKTWDLTKGKVFQQGHGCKNPDRVVGVGVSPTDAAGWCQASMPVQFFENQM